MAVPKQKTSKSRTRSRRAQNFDSTVEEPELSRCPRCGSYHPAHFACPDCGFYDGRQVEREQRVPRNRQL